MATTCTNLLFHIVYSTKYRRNLITSIVQARLYEYIGGIIREQKGIVLEIGGMPDHVHILAKLSPTLAISDVLRVTKRIRRSGSMRRLSPRRRLPGNAVSVRFP